MPGRRPPLPDLQSLRGRSRGGSIPGNPQKDSALQRWLSSRKAGQEVSDPGLRPGDDVPLLDDDEPSAPTRPGAPARNLAPRTSTPGNAPRGTARTSAPSRGAPQRSAGGPPALEPFALPQSASKRPFAEEDEPATVLDHMLDRRPGQLKRLGPTPDPSPARKSAAAAAPAAKSPVRGVDRANSGRRTPDSSGDDPATVMRGADPLRLGTGARAGIGRSAAPVPTKGRAGAAAKRDDPETVQLSRMSMSFLDEGAGEGPRFEERGRFDEVPPAPLPSAKGGDGSPGRWDRSSTTLSRFEHDPHEGRRRASIVAPLLLGAVGGGILVMIILALVAGTLAL